MERGALLWISGEAKIRCENKRTDTRPDEPRAHHQTQNQSQNQAVRMRCRGKPGQCNLGLGLDLCSGHGLYGLTERAEA